MSKCTCNADGGYNCTCWQLLGVINAKVESIKTTAVDRINRGYNEMTLMIPRGFKLIGRLTGERLDLGSATHDTYIVKCIDVIQWADSIIQPKGKQP